MARRSDDLLSLFDPKRQEQRRKRATSRKRPAAKRDAAPSRSRRVFQGLYLNRRQAILAGSAAVLLLLLTFTLGLALGRPGDAKEATPAMRRDAASQRVMMRIRVKRESPITQKQVTARDAVRILVQRHGIPKEVLIRVQRREHVLLIDLGPFRDEAHVDEWIAAHRLAQAEILLEAPFHQREVLPYEPPVRR